MRKAIFLDRDGTLNVDHGYVHSREQWNWLPGATRALRLFRDAGWMLVVASNQSGIGRGYYSREELVNLETWLNEELARMQCQVDAWYYCPHTIEDNCGCRKPKPGLLLRAAHDLKIDLPSSWMIGDRLRDVRAGGAAGCKTGMIPSKAHEEEATIARMEYPQTRIWPDLLAAALEITGQHQDNSNSG